MSFDITVLPPVRPIHRVTRWSQQVADESPWCGADRDAPDVWGYRTEHAQYVTCDACRRIQDTREPERG